MPRQSHRALAARAGNAEPIVASLGEIDSWLRVPSKDRADTRKVPPGLARDEVKRRRPYGLNMDQDWHECREQPNWPPKFKERGQGLVVELRFADQRTVIRQRDLLHLVNPDTGRAMLHWLAGIVATLLKSWTVEMKLVERGSDDAGN